MGSFLLIPCSSMEHSTPVRLAQPYACDLLLILMSSLAIGIIGATVMPHSLFLGSALATQDRVSIKETEKQSEIASTDINSLHYTDSEVTLTSTTKTPPTTVRSMLHKLKRSFRTTFRLVPLREFANEPKNHKDRDNNSYGFVRAHIYHGMFDIVISLLGFAVLINAM